MFTDIHTHNSTSSKSKSIRNISIDEALDVFASNEKGYFSVGLHPWSIDDSAPTQLAQLTKLAFDTRMAAVGECGLDKNCKVDFESQLSIFETQIKLSEKTQKALIIHCVGYFNELFEIKKNLQPKQIWIIHGFRGKPELAIRALKSGCQLSFGQYFNPKSIEITPTENLFVETDESNIEIEEIYKRIAAVRKCRIKDLNAGELFLSKIASHG